MNKQTYQYGQSRLTLEFGDITTSQAQVLVSSDDELLTMGGGVSAAIQRAGGESIKQDTLKKVPAALGDVVVTTAGALPAQHIFHAITIAKTTGDAGKAPKEVIARATRRALDLLDTLGLHSIAFPAIGTGLAGFSYEDVAANMTEVIAGHLNDSPKPIEVTLYLFKRFGGMTPIDCIDFFDAFDALAPQVAKHQMDRGRRTAPTAPATHVDATEDSLLGNVQLQQDIQKLNEEHEHLEGNRNKLADKDRIDVDQWLSDIRAQISQLSLRMEDLETRTVELFYCYAHEDEKLRDELRKQLINLVRDGTITEWHDRTILAGQTWEGKIDQHLNSAHVILLLVSPDFLFSEYIEKVELPRALDRRRAGEAVVIPIILRPCDWEDTSFGELKLQALPKDGEPVTLWKNQDEALLDVALGIKKAVKAFGV